MSYFVLELRSKGEKDINLKGTTYDAEQEVVESVFYKGISLKKTLKAPLTVILDDRRTVYNKKLLDRISINTHQTGLVFLVSPKAQEVFARSNLPIELIDVKIKGKKLELDDYKFVNVIGRINCADHEKSNLEYLDKKIIQLYERLVLDEIKIPPDSDIFLLGEDITMMVIVSEHFKKTVEAAELTGFEFKRPEEYKTFR